MKQLIAKNSMNNMTIVERFIDGDRYLKVTPKNLFPVILDNLKKQFSETSINIESTETGWIKIIKEGEDIKLKESAEKIVGKDKNIDEDYILNKEAEMLKSQGFVVKVEEI